MGGPATLIDPYQHQQQAQPKPALVDPYQQPQAPSIDHDQAQRATDALVYSNMTGAPPSFTYDNRDAIHKDFTERLGEYAEAGWKGFWNDSIAGEILHKQLSGPFDSADGVSKFTEGVGQIIADLPAYVVGGLLGSSAGAIAGTTTLPVVGTISGGVVGGAAGSMALPAALRQWLVDKYSGKQISTFGEAIDIAKAAVKGGITGAAFGVAGEAAPLAEGVVGKYLGARAYKAAAEVATMTTVGSLLEGQVPTARDFAANAALLALLHVTVGNLPFAKRTAPELQSRTMDLYARDGVHPADVVSTASQRAVEESPQDNPMEILNRIDNEIAEIPKKTPEAVEPSTSEESPQAEPQDVSRATLRPALREGEGVQVGQVGEHHEDVIERTGAIDPEHVFVDPQGKVMDRAQAAEWVAKNEPEVSAELKDPKELETHDYNAAAEKAAQTSIQNATTEAERADRGLPEVEVEARRSFGEAFESGKKAVDSGAIDARALAEQLSKNPRALNAEESAALVYDRMRLQNEHAATMGRIEEARAKGDQETEYAGRERLNQIEEAINTNDEAARRTGYEQGLGLAARKMMLKQDYSLANVLQRARAASPDGKVSPEVRDRLESLTRQLDEANKRVDEYEEAKKQRAAENTVEKIKRAARTEKRSTTKEGLKTEYDALIKDLNSELMQLSANPVFNPKLYELFGKLAVNRIQAGLLTIEQIVDDLHGQLQERGISKREIRDYISQYGREVKAPTRNELQVQLREAQKQGKLISAIEDAEKGEEPAKGKAPGKPSGRVKELRKQLDRAMKDAGLTETKSKADLAETSLKAYKTRLTKRIADLQKQLDTGDYSQLTRRDTVLDQQAEDLRARAEKLKSQVDDAIAKQKLEARTPIEKGAAVFQKWRRAVLLSSVGTLGKLTTAAMLRFGTTPIEELVGGVLSHVPGIADIAEKAPREGGGLNLSAEAKAFGQFFEKATRDDIREALKTGKTSLDYLYGKKSTLPPEALDFFGHLHGALKVLPKRAEFFRSLEKRAQWALDNHLDIQDPKVQATLAADAYIDANRAIFMQENFVNTGFRMLMGYFHAQGLSGKATEFMIQTVLPIVKVPTNIVAETGTYAFGSVTGSIKALKTMISKDGLKNLTGHEADNIMRSLKKGSMGLAVLAMGYYAGQATGFITASGFYQPGDEKKKEKPESIAIGGVELPPWIQHTPVGLVFEMGATMRRVNDAYTMKGKSGGFVAGAASGSLGVAKKVPFLEEATRLGEATRTADSAGLFLDDLIESLIIPPDVRKVAQMTDDQKRKPTNLKETLESGIPGLRQNVPTPQKKRYSIRGAYR
jgi:hypothetical protein